MSTITRSIKDLIPNRYKASIKAKYRQFFPEKPDPFPSYMLYAEKVYMGYVQVLSFNHIERFKRFAIYGVTEKTDELISAIKIVSPKGDIVGCVDPIKKGYHGSKESKDGSESLEIDILKKEVPLEEVECLIIALPLEFSDIRYELASMTDLPTVVDIYAVDRFVPEFYHPGIEKYKGIHERKRCFVIGNGPSLSPEDLDTLYNHREICFASNGIYDIYKDTDWREDYYTVVDNRVMPMVKEHLDLYYDRSFIKDEYNYDANVKKESIENANLVHMLQGQADYNHPPFSFDLSRFVYDGGTCVYFSIQLAAYMGFNEIYLLGVDNTVGKSKVDHFTKDYLGLGYTPANEVGYKRKVAEDNWRDNSFDAARATKWSIESAKRYLATTGIKIYNATRGGELEVLERVDFDTLFV